MGGCPGQALHAACPPERRALSCHATCPPLHAVGGAAAVAAAHAPPAAAGPCLYCCYCCYCYCDSYGLMSTPGPLPSAPLGACTAAPGLCWRAGPLCRAPRAEAAAPGQQRRRHAAGAAAAPSAGATRRPAPRRTSASCRRARRCCRPPGSAGRVRPGGQREQCARHPPTNRCRPPCAAETPRVERSTPTPSPAAAASSPSPRVQHWPSATCTGRGRAESICDGRTRRRSWGAAGSSPCLRQ